MQDFYKVPVSPSQGYTSPTREYFEDFEEIYEDDLILISGVIKEDYKDFTDCDLWRICFGGLRLEMFEVERHGLRVEIMAKMRDIKEIREDIDEDKKKGIRI